MAPTNRNMAAVKIQDLDLSKIQVDAVPQRNSRGGKFIRITYGGQNLRIQTPVCHNPFGVSTFTDDKGSETQSVELSFRGADTTPAMQRFQEAIQAIDRLIVDKAVENSVAWFGKPMKLEVLQAFYRPMYKEPRDPKYAGLMKCKVVSQNPPKVYDNWDRSAPQDLSFVTKGSKAMAIIQFNSIWNISNSFGISAKLWQLCVTERPMADAGFCFASDDEADELVGGAEGGWAGGDAEEDEL